MKRCITIALDAFMLDSVFVKAQPSLVHFCSCHDFLLSSSALGLNLQQKGQAQMLLSQ